MDDISTTLQDLKHRVADNGVIFTSGGIGPTHDDVTYEGVAKACGEVSLRIMHITSWDSCRGSGVRHCTADFADVTLQRHEPTIERMKKHYSTRGLELNEARLRMATLPSPAQASYCMANGLPLTGNFLADGMYSTHEALATLICQVLFSGVLWVPLVVAQCGGASVYVLPGERIAICSCGAGFCTCAQFCRVCPVHSALMLCICARRKTNHPAS